MNVRYVCKSSPAFKVTKWFDTESDRVFYDLYIDEHYITRCDTMQEIFKQLEICLIAITIHNPDYDIYKEAGNEEKL